jgi:hypothetical protein
MLLGIGGLQACFLGQNAGGKPGFLRKLKVVWAEELPLIQFQE